MEREPEKSISQLGKCGSCYIMCMRCIMEIIYYKKMYSDYINIVSKSSVSTLPNYFQRNASLGIKIYEKFTKFGLDWHVFLMCESIEWVWFSSSYQKGARNEICEDVKRPVKIPLLEYDWLNESHNKYTQDTSRVFNAESVRFLHFPANYLLMSFGVQIIEEHWSKENS